MNTQTLRIAHVLTACLTLALTAAACGTKVISGGAAGGDTGGNQSTGGETSGGGAGGAEVGCAVDADCDDHEPCTIDVCKADKTCSNVAEPEGMACGPSGSGACHLGECYPGCLDGDACVTNNPCVVGTCDMLTGQCLFLPIPDGTPVPGVAQVAGDCHIRICLGGQDTDAADDSDVPITATDCDAEVCSGGVGANVSKPAGTPCSTFQGNQPGFCDGAGACRECVADGDCAGPVTDCAHPACDPASFTCVQVFAPALTPTIQSPPQVAGDCQSLVCDGSGGTKGLFDASDPSDDGNACTLDVCQAPLLSGHPPVPDGTHCGLGGALSCVAGVCAGCTIDSQCAPASCAGTVLTKAETCNGAGHCVAVAAPLDCAPYLCDASGAGACTTSCADDAGCAQGAYCQAGACSPRRATGLACGQSSECQSGFCVDGVCCGSACPGAAGGCMACSAVKKGGGADGQCGAVANGTDPDGDCADAGPASCGNDGLCDGNGACRKYVAGTLCGASSCAGTVLTQQKVCDGNGACVGPSPATLDCSPYACSGGACASSCANDAQCVPTSYCNAGTCAPKLPAGSVCGAANQCQSGQCSGGVCGLANGASCASSGQCASGVCSSVNNVCCASACPVSPIACGSTGVCQPGTGMCQYQPFGTSCGTDSCGPVSMWKTHTCDGLGTCNHITANCPDGLACQDPGHCWGACMTDDVNGDMRCAPGNYCNSAQCLPKKATGVVCNRPSQCISGICNPTNSCN